jgi:hypothetical protein
VSLAVGEGEQDVKDDGGQRELTMRIGLRHDRLYP